MQTGTGEEYRQDVLRSLVRAWKAGKGISLQWDPAVFLRRCRKRLHILLPDGILMIVGKG